MDFIQLLFYSSIISSAVFLVFLLIKRQFKELFNFTKKQYLRSFLLGLFNPVAYYFVLLKAYSILPAQLAQPLNYTWPIVLVLLSAPLLKQKLKFKSVIALFISFLGVYIIASRNAPFQLRLEQPLGVILASGSSVVWALYWILNVKDSREEIIKLSLGFFFSIPITTFLLYTYSTFKLPSINGILAATYIGFFEMGFTFILWMKALQLTDRNDKLSNLVYISPFLALIWIHLILGEEIFKTTIIGLVLIILGIFVQQIRVKKAKKVIN